MKSHSSKPKANQQVLQMQSRKEQRKMRYVCFQYVMFCVICSFLAFCFLYQRFDLELVGRKYTYLFEQGVIKNQQSCFMQHFTILVSDLEKAKAWYEKILPLETIERKIQTATKGAWYNIKGIELHLLERKELVGNANGGRITGQHIGLHLGPIGDIREQLFSKGISVTLAPENQKGQQAMFVPDEDLLTWEYTDINKRDRPMELLLAPTTLSPKTTNIPLNRPSASKTDESANDKPYKFAISSGNAIATAAGHACLQIGGSAADAAIVAASIMSVVEPFNGGLGGDFVAMLYDPEHDEYSVLNGSGQSPKNAKPLSEKDKIPLDGPFSAMSVPGTAAAWCNLHSKYGKLPWDLVLQPAIMLASEGFLVNNRTAQVWENGAKRIVDATTLSDAAKEEFLTMFAPPASNGMRMTPRAGERFYNPTLGATYQKFADGGCEWFYEHAARDIVAHIQHHGGYKGSPDLRKDWQETASDHVAWENPLSTVFQTNEATYEVLTSGENTQAASALMILNTLNSTLPEDGENFDEVLHKHISAKRIIYRDTFRQPYTQELIDGYDYIESAKKEMNDAFRKQLAISMEKSPIEQPHDTEGLVVTDSSGFTISVLQSIALPFGSGVIVPSLGLPIHNRAYGFTTKPTDIYCFGPGKRPWTTLSPYMVKRNGKFWMAASVKGGDRQPYSFTQIFLNMVHHGLSPQDAVLYPRFRDKSHGKKNAPVEFDLPPYIATDTNQNHVNEFNQRIDYLDSHGYSSEIFTPEDIEDSGFGVAQIILDESDYANDGSKISTQYTAISDLGRKPGLALTGEQAESAQAIELDAFPSIIHPRDLRMLTEQLTNYYQNSILAIENDEIIPIS